MRIFGSKLNLFEGYFSGNLVDVEWERIYNAE